MAAIDAFRAVKSVNPTVAAAIYNAVRDPDPIISGRALIATADLYPTDPKAMAVISAALEGSNEEMRVVGSKHWV